MKHVRRSKEPSLRQMQNMTDNLSEKLKTSACINQNIWTFQTGGVIHTRQQRFWLSLTNDGPVTVFSEEFKSWKLLQDKYFDLMEHGI